MGPSLLVAIILAIIVLVVVFLFISSYFGQNTKRFEAQSQSDVEARASACNLACRTASSATSCKSWRSMFCGTKYDSTHTCYEAFKSKLVSIECKNKFGSECTCEPKAACWVACEEARAQKTCDGWKNKYCKAIYKDGETCFEASKKSVPGTGCDSAFTVACACS